MNDKFPLVAITWIDHCSSDSWYNSVEEIIEVCNLNPIITCAFLVHEDDKSYLVCHTVSSQHFTGSMRILKGTVTDFQRLSHEATLEHDAQN